MPNERPHAVSHIREFMEERLGEFKMLEQRNHAQEEGGKEENANRLHDKFPCLDHIAYNKKEEDKQDQIRVGTQTVVECGCLEE